LTRVLIIGGAGFIGSHLARHCIARGGDVHIAARPQADLWRLTDIQTNLTLHSLDLRDRVALDRCFAEARPDEVYHLATQVRWQPTPDFSDALQSVSTDVLNLIAVLAAASAANPPPRIMIRAGSLAEYGNGPVPYVESQRENPLNSYAAALTACTHCAQMLQSRLPFATLTARLALTYGPTQNEDFLIPTLVRNCLAGKRTRILRPDDRRDLIYVTDVTEALCRLARSELPGGTIVNIATGIAPPMRDVAGLVARVVGADPALIDIIDTSGTVGEAHNAYTNICGSPALTRKLLDWEASITLIEGLQRILDSIRDRNKTHEARQ
jgi:nucleoside-diphosphate-sugar epimerase